jgi:hypothetical protein
LYLTVTAPLSAYPKRKEPYPTSPYLQYLKELLNQRSPEARTQLELLYNGSKRRPKLNEPN